MNTQLFSKLLLILCLLLSYGRLAQSEELAFQFTDDGGDATATPDLASMKMTFNNQTGEYTIILTAHPSRPFFGAFRINVNLYNPNTGTINRNPSFFNDAMNDYKLTSPTNTLILAGTNTNLLAWRAGHKVAANASPFGHPRGVGFFRTGVGTVKPAASAEDRLGPADATNFKVISPAVVTQFPTDTCIGLGLLVTALIFLIWTLKRQRSGKETGEKGVLRPGIDRSADPPTKP